MDDSEGRVASTDADSRVPTVRYERADERPATHLRSVVERQGDGETVAGIEGVRRVDGARQSGGSRSTDGDGRTRWLTVVRYDETEETIEYRPYGPHGALLVLVGVIFALPTVFVSLLLSAVGYLLYRIRRPLAVPIVRVAVLEAQSADRGTESADVGADSGTDEGATAVEGTVVEIDGELAVDAERLADLDWSQRKAVVAEVREWAVRARGDGPHRQTDDDVFFGHVSSWRKRDAATSIQAVEEVQRDVFADREQRRTYTSILRDAAADAPTPPDDGELAALRPSRPSAAGER